MCFLGFGGLCIHRKSTQGTAQRVLVSRELYLLLLVVAPHLGHILCLADAHWHGGLARSGIHVHGLAPWALL